jgi:TRAP-type C4-dicarboxylate transport system substrate-binding protein
LFCFLSIGLSAYGQEGKVIRLKFASFYPVTGAPTAIFESWCKKIETRTGGKVKISMFNGATLAPIPQTYDCVIRGLADISVTSPQWAMGRFPLTDVLYLPIGARSSYQATKMAGEWFKKFQPKEYDDTKMLCCFASAIGGFMTLKPLPSVNDLKGLKIKAAGRTAPIVSAVGAVPVSAVLSELYENLMMGVAEGAILPIDGLSLFKIGELIKGLQLNDGLGNPSATVLVMNKTKWNSLPADIKKIFETANEELLEDMAKSNEEEVRKAIEFGVSKGMKVFKISAEEVELTRKNVRPILDDYVKRMKDKGLPGEESLKFCLDYANRGH